MTKSNIQKFWNLSSPKMCRDFLKNAYLKNSEGQTMGFTKIMDENGKEYSIDEAPDEAVLQIANDIVAALGHRKK